MNTLSKAPISKKFMKFGLFLSIFGAVSIWNPLKKENINLLDKIDIFTNNQYIHKNESKQVFAYEAYLSEMQQLENIKMQYKNFYLKNSSLPTELEQLNLNFNVQNSLFVRSAYFDNQKVVFLIENKSVLGSKRVHLEWTLAKKNNSNLTDFDIVWICNGQLENERAENILEKCHINSNDLLRQWNK